MNQHELCDRVARKVAGRWRNKGIQSSSFDEMYQDAYCKALQSLPKFDKSAGYDLEGYLYTSANNCVHGEVTRRCHPVSTRSNGYIEDMGRTVIGVVSEDCTTEDGVDYEHLVYLTQVRTRMEDIAKRAKDGQRALACAMGYTTAATATSNKQERAALYANIRALKADMLNDHTLYKMARDYHA